jgi:hypothetical protein
LSAAQDFLGLELAGVLGLIVVGHCPSLLPSQWWANFGRVLRVSIMLGLHVLDELVLAVVLDVAL